MVVDFSGAIDLVNKYVEHTDPNIIDPPYTYSIPVNSKYKDATIRKKELSTAFKVISDYFSITITPSNSNLISQNLTNALQALLHACGDDIPDIRLAADEHLNIVIKATVGSSISEKVLVILFKGTKLPNKLSQKEALKNFANVARFMKPQKCRTFVTILLPQFKLLFSSPNSIIMPIMAEVLDKTLKILGYHITAKEAMDLVTSITPVLSNTTAEIRRNAAQCIAQVCKHVPQCPIDEICMNIHEIAHSVLKINKVEKKEVVTCSNLPCLQGCVNTFINLLDVLLGIGNRNVQNSSNYYSQNQIFSNLISDLLTYCLSINDQNILSPSLELLSRLLSQYSSYCSQWRKEKVLILLEKLYYLLRNNPLPTVKSYVVEALAKICEVFTTVFVESTVSNQVSIEEMIHYLNHSDYFIRGKTAVWIATIIQQSIINSVDITVIPYTAEKMTNKTVSTGSLDIAEYPIAVELLLNTDETAILAHLYERQKDSQEELVTEEVVSTRSNIQIFTHLLSLLLHKAHVESSSLCLKLICNAFGLCLPVCVHVAELCNLVPIYLFALTRIDDSFWGVKFELLELLERFDFTLLAYYGGKNNIGHSSTTEALLNVIWKYIIDENERVRQKACEALMHSLPHLNLHSTNFSSESIKRSMWNFDYERMLLKQVVSKEIHYEPGREVIRDHELLNASILLKQCLEKLRHVANDKHQLVGYLHLLNSIAKQYGSYDEQQFYLINVHKGAVCVQEESFLAQYTLEVIDMLFDLIKWYEASTDLSVHANIIETLGLFTLQLEYFQQESDSTTLQYVTNRILNYLLFLLDTMNDLKTKSPDIDSNPYGIVISKIIFEKFLENVSRSLRTTGSSITQDDAVSQLLDHVFKTLYFLIVVGDSTIVTSRTAKIIQHLQTNIQHFEEYGILCIQELFVTLFGKKSTYFSVHINYEHSPQLVYDLDCELFDKLFIHGKNLQHTKTNSIQTGRQRSKSSALKTGFNKKNMLIQSGKVGDLTVTQILDLFEPVVLSIKESFKFTHSQKIQSLILFMLSRMVLTGVDFTRLDKDHSFLQHIIKLINDMHLFQSAEEDKFNTLHQIIDFVSILLFTVKYKPEELNQDTLFSAITTGISSSNWTISFILQSLGPLLIRSYTDFIRMNKTNEEGKVMENPYGEAILALILKHVGFTQCMKVLTLLLKTVSKADVSMWKNLSFIIAQKFFVENKTQVQIDWFKLNEELDVIFLFLESLFLDLKDTSEGHYASVLKTMLQELYDKALQKEKELLDSNNNGDVLTLEANESVILQMLVVMKTFNLQHADTPTNIKLDVLAKFLTFCNLGFHFHLNSQLRDVYLERIVLRMIPECLSLLTSLYNFYYDSSKLYDLEPMFLQLLQTLQRMEHSRSNDFHNYSHFHCGLFSCVVSILVYYSNMNDKFETKMFEFLNSNLKHSVQTHAEAVTKYTHFLAMIHLLSLSKQTESFFVNSVNLLHSDFWKICFYMYSDQKTIEFFDKLRNIKFAWATDSLLEFLREELDRYIENRMLLRLRNLIDFVSKLPPLPELKHFILSYQSQLTLRIEKHLYHQLCSHFRGIPGTTTNSSVANTNMFDENLLLQRDMLNHPNIAFSSLTREKLDQMINNSQHINITLLADAIPYLDTALVLPLLRSVIQHSTLSSPHLLDLVGRCIIRTGLEYTAEDISTICKFICTHVDEIFVKVTQGTIQMLEVDGLIYLLYSSLLFLKQNMTIVPEEVKDEVLLRVCKMLIDASSISHVDKSGLSLDALLKRVIGHIFPLSESQTLKLPTKESLLGNQIPFIYPHHLKYLYPMHISIAEMYLHLAFDPYTKDMLRIDLPQLRNLIRMVSTLQMTDTVFQEVWNLAYDLFQAEISVQGYDELQLDSVKLLTILLVKMRFKEETEETKQKYKSFTAFKVNANKHSVLLSNVTPIRHADLQILSNHVEEFLFSLNNEHLISSKTCLVDTIYGLASFDMCIVSIENAIRQNLNNNVMLSKELIKSLCLLLIHNPSVFGQVEGKSSSKHYTVENLFSFFQQLLQEPMIKDDTLTKFYLVIGLVRAFCLLQTKDPQFITQMNALLQELFVDQACLFALYLSIVYLLEEKQVNSVVKLISGMSDKITQLLQDERRIQHKLIIIHMIAYVIQSMPDLSVNGFVKKSIEAMFTIADLGTTPFVVVDYICAVFRNLLLSNGLPVLERKMIENTTAMKQTCFVSTKASIQKNNEEKLKADALGSRFSLDIQNASAYRKQQSSSTTSRLLFWRKSPTPTTPQTPAQQTQQSVFIDTSAMQTQPKKKVALTKEEQRQLERLESKRQQDSKSVVANPISRQTLLLLNTISSMYANFLNAVDANIIEMVKEKNKTLTLQLLQDIDSRVAERRDTELIFALLPQLIGSFFERDQILPMIFGDFLRKDKFSAKVMLCSVLYRYIPELYKKDKKLFEDWVGIALDTISMKKPTLMAVWALLCLFVSASSAWDSSLQWIFVEVESFSTKFILQKWDPLHERIFFYYLKQFLQGIQRECSETAQQSMLQSLRRIFGSDFVKSDESPFVKHLCEEVIKLVASKTQ